MPTITIYLTNELYDKVKNAPSQIVRAALEHYFTDESAEPAKPSEQPEFPTPKTGRDKEIATSE